MFADRRDAGRRLAAALADSTADLSIGSDAVVAALPRGGVPVAAEVASVLDLSLDVIIVRKLGVPMHPEYAMGAVGEAGVRVVDDDVRRRAGVTDEQLDRTIEREELEIVRRGRTLRSDRDRVDLAGRPVVIVDDGIATGSTARAACQVARRAGATRITLAVPVAPSDWTERLAGAADEYVAVETHRDFVAVGLHYRDFTQVTTGEVLECLDRRG